VNILTGIVFSSGIRTSISTTTPFASNWPSMALAGINVLVFYSAAFREVQALGPGADAPLRAKFITGISLGSWGPCSLRTTVDVFPTAVFSLMPFIDAKVRFFRANGHNSLLPRLKMGNVTQEFRLSGTGRTNKTKATCGITGFLHKPRRQDQGERHVQVSDQSRLLQRFGARAGRRRRVRKTRPGSRPSRSRSSFAAGAGGASDQMARMMQAAIQKNQLMKQPMVVSLKGEHRAPRR